MTTNDQRSNGESEGLPQVMESYARLLKTQLEEDHAGLAADYRLASRTPPGFHVDGPQPATARRHDAISALLDHMLNAIAMSGNDAPGDEAIDEAIIGISVLIAVAALEHATAAEATLEERRRLAPDRFICVACRLVKDWPESLADAWAEQFSDNPGSVNETAVICADCTQEFAGIVDADPSRAGH